VTWPWKKSGHGLYTITSDSFTYSSISDELNAKKESFSFMPGSIIKLEFNPFDKRITFRKES
jgi:hypothetical protein